MGIRDPVTGRFLPGQTGNPAGRLPRQTESEYLEITMQQCTTKRWAEVVAQAVADALDESPHVRARAREWLAKYVIGEPNQLHQLLYREEKSFEIIVKFSSDNPQALPGSDVIDIEPVLINGQADQD